MNQSEIQFNFQLPQNQRLNTLFLENLEIDEINQSGDIAAFAPALKNFVSSAIDEDDVQEIQFETFEKILKMSQIAMEYYTKYQEEKESLLEMKMKEFEEKQQRLDALKKIKQSHEKKDKQLDEELQGLKENLQKIKEEQLNKALFKCHHCEKVFQSKDFLGSHMEKKHPPQQNEKLANLSNPDYFKDLISQMALQSAANQNEIDPKHFDLIQMQQQAKQKEKKKKKKKQDREQVKQKNEILKENFEEDEYFEQMQQRMTEMIQDQMNKLSEAQMQQPSKSMNTPIFNEQGQKPKLYVSSAKQLDKQPIDNSQKIQRKQSSELLVNQDKNFQFEELEIQESIAKSRGSSFLEQNDSILSQNQSSQQVKSEIQRPLRKEGNIKKRR